MEDTSCKREGQFYDENPLSSKRSKGEEELLLDPCTLPEEIFAAILSNLDPEELSNCSLVCSAWRHTSQSHTVWRSMCDRLWSDKVYVPRFIKEMRATDPKVAYRTSIKDSKRHYLTDEELFSFEWCFRFKSNPGHDWADNDPWWNDKAPSRHRYLPNGSIKIVSGDFTGYDHQNRRWRWIRRMGGREAPFGSFVQINHYPAYVVFRLPNWGFLQQSLAAVLTSFEMPPKGECLELEDEALNEMYEKQPSERRSRRYSAQSMSIPVQLMDALLRSGLLGGDFDDEEDEEEQDDMPLEMHMTSVQLDDVETHAEDPTEEVPVVAEARQTVVECELD